mmetsp:Transcript_152923/g.267233  ORF Transcript_152923/g.267233 Transcript_152923/m.267233 type:complete len:204 (-) Transcript_152923:878-1489(-)
MMPPTLTCLTTAASSLACSFSQYSTSSMDLVQGSSGCRRMVPVAEHGASSRTMSNSSGGLYSAASEQTTATEPSSPVRFRFSRNRCSRFSAWSIASTVAPAAASWRVLPPGAAQTSATFLPFKSPKSLTGSDAAMSCTHHSPSSKPGSCVTVTAEASAIRTVPVGRTTPPRASAHLAGSVLTVMSRGASRAWACAMAAATSAW